MNEIRAADLSWITVATLSICAAARMALSSEIPRAAIVSELIAFLSVALMCFLITREKGRLQAVCAAVISLAASAVLVVLMTLTGVADSAAADSAQEAPETSRMLVAVNSKDSAETISDLSGYTIGIFDNGARTDSGSVVDDIREAAGDIKIKRYPSAYALAGDIASGKKNLAAIYLSAYDSMLCEKSASFADGRRIIYTKDLEKIREEEAEEKTTDAEE